MRSLTPVPPSLAEQLPLTLTHRAAPHLTAILMLAAVGILRQARAAAVGRVACLTRAAGRRARPPGRALW